MDVGQNLERIHIQAMYGFDSILYFAYQPEFQPFGLPLYIGAINTLAPGEVFSSIPTVVGGYNLIEVILADDNYVYIGGGFQVELADGSRANNRIL